ncbi:MAG: Xaa-Pro aminopeptidase [Myxococcota bacterium]|jgi:Xaa-Pro aminopeptidase|nr:Xaa-Pro aminopeptidase [Myxococcota bacterium]
MDARTYETRRNALRQAVPQGALLLLGHREAARNYPANTYRFRQDSNFLYFVGTNCPDMALLLEPDGKATLYGPAEDSDDLIWHGPHATIADHAREAGLSSTASMDDLPGAISGLRTRGIDVHFLPPQRDSQALGLSKLLGVAPGEVASHVSSQLIAAVVAQRSIKSEAEVREIEDALATSRRMYAAAYPLIRAGRKESEIAAAIQSAALAEDRAQSFQPIVSVRGEVLHNESYAGTLQEGQLLLVDTGTESSRYYASDITRTYPVSGKFTDQQRGIYSTVLAAQFAAIGAASPSRTNKELHLLAARTIVEGLASLGLMRGDVEEAVAQGAHALFYPHGIGHMLGLDVHDMEDLGDAVGYEPGVKRSQQFGLAFLRLARKLEPGFVITVEPGIYFIPALIDRWRQEKRHEAFINYPEVEKYRSFGGVRIEDDLLITGTGSRVLGKPIPKTVAEIEAVLAR